MPTKMTRLIAFGGILAIVLFGVLWFEGYDQQNEMFYDAAITGSVFSPDQTYKAILFNQNGGGAIAPYCFDLVSVVPENIDEKIALTLRYVVFVASCGAINYQKWNADIQWLGSKELRITFDYKIGARGISKLRIQNHDVEEKILITYEDKNQI